MLFTFRQERRQDEGKVGSEGLAPRLGIDMGRSLHERPGLDDRW